jgi:fluoroquinolone transport system permease protein
MKNITALIINDFKNIFRDDILKILLFVPAMMVAILHFGLPFLIKLAPVVDEYSFLIITCFCLIISSFPAFIISFIMLDEKDEGIFIMFKVLPISGIKFFAYRMAFIIIFSWFFSFLLLLLEYSGKIQIWQLFSASVLFSLLPPVLCLLTVTLAKNKIEGMSLMKFLNFILMLPAAAFFIDVPWKYFFGIIPVFWSYRTMEAVNHSPAFIFSLLTGILFHLLILRLIFRRFVSRI